MHRTASIGVAHDPVFFVVLKAEIWFPGCPCQKARSSSGLALPERGAGPGARVRAGVGAGARAGGGAGTGVRAGARVGVRAGAEGAAEVTEAVFTRRQQRRLAFV